VQRDTGVTAVERVTGSIYSADPRVDRHHIISISSYHTLKIHTVPFPTFGLTPLSTIWWIHAIVCDSQWHVVSYLFTISYTPRT
jgi:hypothetical protein